MISGSSDILANLGDITAVTVSDSGQISLTKAQVELAGVNDGTGSAMDLMTGGTLLAAISCESVISLIKSRMSSSSLVRLPDGALAGDFGTTDGVLT